MNSLRHIIVSVVFIATATVTFGASAQSLTALESNLNDDLSSLISLSAANCPTAIRAVTRSPLLFVHRAETTALLDALSAPSCTESAARSLLTQSADLVFEQVDAMEQSIAACINASNFSPVERTGRFASLDTAIADVEDDLDEMMQMLRLQSQMSQRSTVLQAIINIVKSTHQTEESVVHNL